MLVTFNAQGTELLKQCAKRNRTHSTTSEKYWKNFVPPKVPDLKLITSLYQMGQIITFEPQFPDL